MQRWDRAKGLNPGGRLHNPHAVIIPSGRNVNQPLIPASVTPYHTFFGRAPGDLEVIIASMQWADCSPTPEGKNHRSPVFWP